MEWKLHETESSDSVVDKVHKSSKSTDTLVKYYSNKNIKYSFSILLE